jgi:hypothetical protein
LSCFIKASSWWRWKATVAPGVQSTIKYNNPSVKRLFDTLSSSFGCSSYVSLKGLNRAIPLRQGINSVDQRFAQSANPRMARGDGTLSVYMVVSDCIWAASALAGRTNASYAQKHLRKCRISRTMSGHRVDYGWGNAPLGLCALGLSGFVESWSCQSKRSALC